MLDKDGYQEGFHSIESEMNSVWNDTFTTYQSFQLQGDMDTRFTLGDQSLYGRFYQNLVNSSEYQFNFNHILKVINMISGYQIRNRKSPQIIGQENSDDTTASLLSNLVQWVYQKSNMYDLVSEAFRQALITGFGALELWLDPRSDPVSPDIKCSLKSYASMIFDPYFTNKDMSDATFMWSRSYLTPDEVNQMLPDREKDIESLRCKNGYKDDKFQYMLENWNLTQSKLMAVDSYYHLCTRNAKYFIDIYSGEEIEIDDSLDKEMINYFIQQNERIQVDERNIPSIKLALAVNGKVLYSGNPMKLDRYPIIPFFGYLNTASPMFQVKIQGVTRSIRDIQFLYNRRKRTELDIIESRGTSTLAIMQGTLVDDRQAFQTGPGKAMFVKRDAPMGLDGIRPLPAPQVGADMIQLSQQLKEEMIGIPGISEELLGSASDDVSGILSMLRQGAGLTTLRSLFDNVDFSQTLLTKSIMELIQGHWQPSKVRRIADQEPTPQFKNKAFQKYDAIVINGEFSAEQRQMEFVQLLELQKLGIPVPVDRLIDTMTVQNKDKLLQSIQQQQQAQEQQEQKKQALELEQLKAQNELVKARALADSGLGVERISRIQENKMLAQERLSESQRNREAATLDVVRTLKEIQDMDLDRLVKAYTLYKSLEEDQQLGADQQKEQLTPGLEEALNKGIGDLNQEENQLTPKEAANV